MKLKLVGVTVLLVITIFSNKVFSQNYLGVINSNYAGVMGADLQPASIVDGRFVVDVNMFSLNVDVWQNIKYFDAGVLPGPSWLRSLRRDTEWMDDPNLYENSVFDVRDYTDPNARPMSLYMGAQLDVMNFMFHINPKIAVGFSAKLRFINNVDHINPELGRLAEEGLDFDPLWNQQINGSLLSQNSLSWAEYGVNYAQVLYDEGEHFFKVGGRVKLLQGISSNYLHASDLDFEMMNKDTATTFRGNFNFGYSDNIDEYVTGQSSFSASEYFRLTSDMGFGFDIGGVYEWRPDWEEYKYDMDGETNIWRRDKNKYKLRVGASLVDVGWMRFQKSGSSRDFSVDTENLDMRIFEETSSLGSFADIVDSLILNDPDWVESEDTAAAYTMNTPAAFSLQADYHIWKDFYVNVTGYLNLNRSENATNVRMPNMLSVTPSYDFKWLGVSVPMMLHQQAGFIAGLGARLGPLTVGVPDIKTLFPFGKVRGAGFYAGLRVPILYGHPSDMDGDKVSDELDECPEVPGVWDFRGCPDSDEDGIPDAEDECPFEAGLPEFDGCPDTDGDGIPDKDDACPEEAGLPEFDGCPDRDGDGIPDHEDACPDTPGPKELDGCPDTDGDGILDYLDECPDTPGPKENQGCPWPDTDGDGILDKDDDCPNLPGPKSNQGCPYTDTDGDGIPDKDDECPETPGTVENKGCPEIEEEVKEVLKTAFDNLEFETARAKIKAESVESLNELAEVLKKEPKWGLQIEGHTDNVGRAQSNLILSKQRAESVRDFMIERGIDKDRMTVLYFGETMPIESNDTPEGRQANRRVEMTIIFK